MERPSLKKSNHNDLALEPDFYGASIVTASGEEIPITEKMLQQSFRKLIEAWERARTGRKPA